MVSFLFIFLKMSCIHELWKFSIMVRNIKRKNIVKNWHFVRNTQPCAKELLKCYKLLAFICYLT